jgi:phosphate transport system substrate-binding protein
MYHSLSSQKPGYGLWLGLVQAVAVVLAVLGLSAPGAARKEETLVVEGSGTSNPAEYLAKLIHIFNVGSKPPLKMRYRSIGSGPGIDEYINNGNRAPINDFHVSDLTLPEREINSLNNTRTPLQVPFGLHGVSFFHSVSGYSSGGARGLNLTVDLLASIFQRNITSWLHPDIVFLNPRLRSTLPSEGPTSQIGVVVRRLGSSSTFGISTYLNETSNDWVLGAGRGGDGNDPSWPADVSSVANSGKMIEFLRENPSYIGYVEAGTGQAAELPEVKVKNANGTFLSSDEASYSDALSTALSETGTLSKALDSGIDDAAAWIEVPSSLMNQGGHLTWPIVLLSHFYVDKESPFDDSVSETRALLKAFIDFTLSNYGQAIGRQFSFAPMSDIERPDNTSLTDEVLNQVDNLLEGFTEPYRIEDAGTVETAIAAEDRRVISVDNVKSYPRIERERLNASIATLRTDFSGFVREDNTLNDKTYGVAIAALLLTIIQFVVLIVVASMALINSRKLRGYKHVNGADL